MIHDITVKKTGGSFGIREVGLLQLSVAKPKLGFGGEELYTTIWMKAAVMMKAIIDNHPFVDGNKRTGIAAASAFLRINGYDLQFKDKQGYAITMKAAKGEIKVNEIADWLKRYGQKK